MANKNSSEAYSADANANITKLAELVDASNGGINFTDTATPSSYTLTISAGKIVAIDQAGALTQVKLT